MRKSVRVTVKSRSCGEKKKKKKQSGMAGEHQGKERGEPEPVELFWLRFSVQVAVLFLDCSFVYDATTTAPRDTGVSVARGTVFIKPAADALMLPTR